VVDITPMIKRIAIGLLCLTAINACNSSDDNSTSTGEKKTRYGKSVERAHALQTPSAEDEAFKKQAEDLGADE